MKLSKILRSLKGFGYHPSEQNDELYRQRKIWEEKPQVRSFYKLQVFPRIIREINGSGITLEVGAGSGTLKDYCPSLVASDLVATPWLDVCCDACCLSFPGNSLNHVVGINVLHHLADPGSFFHEAERVLVPGGKAIFCEPWITPVSSIFYRFFHQEDFFRSADPFDGVISNEYAPMKGNSYLPYQLVQNLHFRFPNISVRKIELFSCLGWCLSKGFRPGAMLSDRLLRVLLELENKTDWLWGRLAALNALIVLEKGRR